MAKQILLVDDERDLVRSTKLFLEGRGYDVLEAFDGRQALQVLSEHRPDLIVLDIGMPGMTGWDVLSEIRGRSETAHIPVLMLTGRDAVADKALGWQADVSWYQTKPFELDNLIVIIERILAVGDDWPKAGE